MKRGNKSRVSFEKKTARWREYFKSIHSFKVFVAPELYLKLCHRANSVIVGELLSNSSFHPSGKHVERQGEGRAFSLSLCLFSRCLPSPVFYSRCRRALFPTHWNRASFKLDPLVSELCWHLEATVKLQHLWSTPQNRFVREQTTTEVCAELKHFFFYFTLTLFLSANYFR